MAHIADLQANVHVGLNNFIARETSPHSPQEGNRERGSPQQKERYTWRLNPSSTNGPSARFHYRPSPTAITEHSPRYPSPDHERAFALATERSDSAMSTKSDQGPVIFPSRLGGQEVLPLGRRRKADHERALALATERSESAMSTKSDQGPSTFPYRSGAQEVMPLGRRRKASVPELGPMTTVQEACQDSPTIPGRPPLHERSSSAPSWRNFTVNDSDIPRVSPLDTRQRKGRNPLLAKTLTPLVIPASGPNVSHLRTCSLDAVDVPPQVPPKSARHGEGASPMRRGLETPPSAWSSTTYTNTPFSAMGGWEPSKPWATPITGNSPIEARRRPSENSISNRGRPIIRSNGNLKHQGNNTNKRSPSAEERAFQTLPVGFRPMEAVSRLRRQEIEELQQQAISQVDRYAVLSMKDVQSLSKELRALDERCEYLRKTHASLRAGRRSLHGRMIAYLKSPRVAVFTRESLLKQEEALADLDLSIDDWVSKLEQAENRRTRVRQKLLEHVAAASTLGLDQPKQWGPPQEQTPPRSPEKEGPQCRTERRDVESIKIYADSDIFALLADVEQEIEGMVKTCIDHGFNGNMI